MYQVFLSIVILLCSITCVRTQRPLWSWSVPPAPTLGTVQDTSVGKRLHRYGGHVEVTEATQTCTWGS